MVLVGSRDVLSRWRWFDWLFLISGQLTFHVDLACSCEQRILPSRRLVSRNGTEQRLTNVSLNAERPFVLDIFESIIDAIALIFESIGHSSGTKSKARNRQPLLSKKHVI